MKKDDKASAMKMKNGKSSETSEPKNEMSKSKSTPKTKKKGK